MAQNTNVAVAPFGAILVHNIIHAVELAVVTVKSWNQARATRIALHSLSDTVLEDIGVTRWEIDSRVR